MKILVRGTNWIGDSVMSVPALRLIKKAFPDSEVTLAAPAWSEGVFRDADFVDEILVLEESGHSPGSIIAQAGKLRKGSFDLAILLPNSFGSALVTRSAGIAKRFGYAGEARGFLLTKAFAKPGWKNSRHEAFYYLNLIEETTEYLGKKVPSDKPDFSIPVSEARRSSARDQLEQAGLQPDESYAVMGAGSTNSRAKRWPADRFAKVADRLTRELGLRPILLGSAAEIEVSTTVCENANTEIVDLTGRTLLEDAVAIISEAKMMISNDMGLAHISAAVGTPTVTIFGPTNHLTTAPFGAEIVRVDVECSPCMLRDCPIDHRCMTRIEPEDVFERASNLLAALPTGSL
jgi:heptosyltransferase-2